MEPPTAPRTGDVSPSRAGNHPAWLLALLALLAWQGWLTAGLFGPEPLACLLDDRPILSGRHPLHLYHGALGARSLAERGSLSCYDPAFHAGYPKTPVFDSGSRPAELAQALAGGRYSPAAYKIELALVCLAVPVAVFLAARGTGMGRAASCLAALLAVLVWWGRPCREALDAGAVDLLLAALLAVAQAGFLLRYHTEPGPLALFGVVATSLLGWFAHPLVFGLLLPLFLIYYLSVGTRHRLAWHGALLGGLLAAVGANAFWLIDWVGYWWIRVPARLEAPLLTQHTLAALWQAPLWGGPADRALDCGLLAAAAGGVVLFNQRGRRAAARLFGLGAVGFLVLVAVGLTWGPLGRYSADYLLLPALLFAVVPAAHAAAATLSLASRPSGQGRRADRRLLGPAGPRAAAGLAVASLAVLAVLGVAFPGAFSDWLSRFGRPRPFEIGLDEQRWQLLAVLCERTDDSARILWEDRREARPSATEVPHIARETSHWTALLPLLSGRSYVGGLDAEAGIEHTTAGLVDQVLLGRPIGEWDDAALMEYCGRYNIGWIVCWSAGAQERFRRWAGSGKAELLATLPPASGDQEPGCLFTVRRPRSFALAGSAQWLCADAQHIVLADVVPQSMRPRTDGQPGPGQVVLSLHYQAGMRVAPSRVTLEPVEELHDAIPFVRLRVREPVARVTITWEKRP
jgi:hypothetical protein